MSSDDTATTLESVKVHITGSDVALPGKSARSKPTYRASYETFVLTANDPVQCILPADPDRVIAHVIPVDNDIVIGTRSQVIAPANTVASVPTPIGALVPSKTTAGAAVMYPVLDNGEVHAGATTTASNTRVSVSATYRQ